MAPTKAKHKPTSAAAVASRAVARFLCRAPCTMPTDCIARLNARATAATGLLALSLALGGCAAELGEQVSTEGRVPVLSQVALTATNAAPRQTVRIPRATNYPHWSNTGGTSSHANQNLALAADPKLIWRTQLLADVASATSAAPALRTEVSEGWSTLSPVVMDEVIFTLNSNLQVSAINTADGTLRWRTRFNRGIETGEYLPRGGGLAVSSVALVAINGDGVAAGIQPQTGRVMWVRSLGIAVRQAPTILEHQVVVVGLDGSVMALNARNGATLWRYPSAEVRSVNIATSAPAIESEQVFVRRPSGEVLALALASGDRVWSYDRSLRFGIALVSEIYPTSGSAVATPDAVIAPTLDGQITALRRDNGAAVWAIPASAPQTPAVAGGFMFMLTENWRLSAVSGSDGSVAWQTNLARQSVDEGGEVNTVDWYGPVLAGNRLLLTSSDGRIISISPFDGTPLGQLQISSGFSLAPIVAGGAIYLLDNSENLFALR